MAKSQQSVVMDKLSFSVEGLFLVHFAQCWL